MGTKLLLLSLLLFVSSCGSHIIINPEQCETKGFWGKRNIEKAVDRDMPEFEFEESIWTPFGFAYSTDVYLKQMLEDRAIDCSLLNTLEVEMKTKWYEALLSFVPLMSRKTVILRGTLTTHTFTDEE